MEITTFQSKFLPQAVALFINRYQALRAETPQLPERMANPSRVADMLAKLFETCPGVAVSEDGRLLGYMGWYIIDDFRRTGLRAALSSEWAHASAGERPESVLRALYQAAAQVWFEAGCETHAVSLLGNNPSEERFWFWNGFGLAVVDAVRPIAPDIQPAQSPFTIRMACPDDAAQVIAIDREHCQHYGQPPVLMTCGDPMDEAGFREFVETPGQSIWLALDGDRLASYMVFEGSSFGAAAIVGDDKTVAITGAFTRPEFRGKKAAPSLLNAALRHYQAEGMQRCSVDFESFNPEAAAFWTRHFTPVCFSLLRVPERKRM
jgi:GNAT superfamily N-acetyltransferase